MADTDKKRSRGFWNMLFSAADPELKKLADRIRSAIPESSPFRSVFAERIMGVLKGWAEGKADDLSPIAGAVVEKLTDLGDFFVGGESPPKAERVAGDWMDQFFSEAGRRLKETRAEDLMEEKEKILQEFELRRAILEAIEKGRQAAHPERETKPNESINWGELRAKLFATLKTANASVDDAVRNFRANQRWIRRSRRRQQEFEEVERSPAALLEPDNDPWEFNRRGGRS